jgi:hypothetical protein
MTAQRPDILINEHSVDLRNLKPYWVDPECFPVPPASPDPQRVSSSLWRGYVATMRLGPDGRLELVGYEFPYVAQQPATQPVNRYLSGDFSIVFQPFFAGPQTSVPFRDGTIVADRDRWDIEDQAFSGHLRKLFRDKLDRVRGVIVDYWDLCGAFMPASLIPEDLRRNIESHLGQTVDCLVEEIDEQRGYIVVKPRTTRDPQTGLHSFTHDAELARDVHRRIEDQRREELPYSEGKFVLADSALCRPRRDEDGWWSVYQNSTRGFEIHYHPDESRYRVIQGSRRDDADDMRQVFALLSLSEREPG